MASARSTTDQNDPTDLSRTGLTSNTAPTPAAGSIKLPPRLAAAMPSGLLWAARALSFTLLWHLAHATTSLFTVLPPVSTWYPATGVLFAFGLLYGWRALPLTLAGPMLADFAPTDWTFWAHVLRQTLVFGGTGCYLRMVLGGNIPRRGMTDAVTGLMFAFAAALTAAFLIIPILSAQGEAEILVNHAFITSMAGDATGVLMVAPLCVWLATTIDPKVRNQSTWGIASPTQAIARGTVCAAITAVAYAYIATQHDSLHWEFLTFLPLLWAAFRGRFRGAVIAAAMSNAAAAYVVASMWPVDQLLNAQMQMLAFSVMSLLTGAAVSDRDTAIQRLESNEAFLEDTIAERTRQLRREVARQTELATERDRARDEAEVASAAKSRFIAAASHDLRQPLQALSLVLGLLQTRITDAQARELLDRGEISLDNLMALFNNLIDLSRMEAGKEPVNPREVHLDEVLARITTDLRGHAEQKTLTLRHVPTSATIFTDPLHLERILRNLIGNAVKYTETGGVLVGCRRRGSAIRIDVVDTGPGIPSEHLHKIFTEFHRIDSDSMRGHGLGLAIVQRAAALLGALVGVTSTPGRGSRFYVIFPLDGAHATPHRAHTMPDETPLAV